VRRNYVPVQLVWHISTGFPKQEPWFSSGLGEVHDKTSSDLASHDFSRWKILPNLRGRNHLAP